MGDGETSVRTLDPPIPTPVFEYAINPLVTWLLRSRFHGLLSDALLLITVRGRKSGTEYTTPVGYEQQGDTLYITSQTDRVWWKNLRGGAPVAVRLRGELRQGHADVIKDDELVADYVRAFVDRNGMDSLNRLAIAIDGDELPDQETLAAELSDTVSVRVELRES